MDSSLCHLASKLLSFCGYEIPNIESCSDCYESMHANPNCRSLVCSQPHLLLWIQLKKNLQFWAARDGYLYWPAKMISSDEIIVKVIFFNDTENTDFIEIPRSWCFIYSKKAPKSILKTQSIKNSKDVDKALEVNKKFYCNFISFYRNVFFINTLRKSVNMYVISRRNSVVFISDQN